MNEYQFEISITLKAPFCIPGVEAGAFGYDMVCMRNSDSTPIIPQHQFKGMLADGLRAIKKKDFQERVFGAASGDAFTESDANFEPNRGRIFPTDLVCTTKIDKGALPYYRNHIDEDAGAVKEGHLLTLEQVFKPEELVTFEGKMTLFDDKFDGVEIAEICQMAMYAHLGVGSDENIGMGHIQNVSISVAKGTTIEQPSNTNDLGAGVYSWEFTVDRPYLVNSKRIASNAYLGERDIPGGALKGVFAQMLKLRGIKFSDTDLSAARFGFASQFERAAFPASMVLAKDGLVDLAQASDVISPKLQIDWKRDDFKAAGIETDYPVYDERVHTKLTGGVAEDRMLFSTISVVPDRSKTFTATLDLSFLSAAAANNLIDALSQPLHGLGRTGATVLTSKVKNVAGSGEAHFEAGRYSIVLQTPAFMGVPAQQHDPIDFYSRLWNVLLPGSKLVDCFAQQAVSGGYLAKRYPLSKSEKYMPWILADRGSVFVIDVANDDLSRFKDLVSSGLCADIPDVDSTHGTTWKNCPFVTENGFGAIVAQRIQGEAK